MAAGASRGDDAFAWQVGIWDRMSSPYVHEIDRRFASVVEHVLARAHLREGERVVDLGTGTGSVALLAGAQVGPGGHVDAVDPSPEMLEAARRRASELSLANVAFLEGRAEAIPVADGSADALLASLSLMYVIDRAAAAREIARVLRPGGRLVAAVWAGPEEADIVRFQQLAARFAPPPPVTGVGPGGLADSAPFVALLADAGIAARVERETLGFDFDDFRSAWDTLAGVTAASIPAERLAEAQEMLRMTMWPSGDGPRHFRNVTQFIVGVRE